MSDISDTLRRVSGTYDASYPDWVVNPPTPALTSLAPPSIVAAAQPVTVTLTGTSFTPGSKVWADEEQQPTVYVSATTLRYAAEADMAGSQTITVHNGGEVSNAVELTVAAAQVAATQTTTQPAGFDPSEHTVAEVEEYVAAHPDERDAVYAAEQAGKARVTLLDSLAPEES